jgi:AraC-like DNA-binding protein
MSSGLREVPAASSEVDRLLYRGDLVAVGAWRCPVEHVLFDDSGPIRDHCITFPRSATIIQPANAEPYLADPTVVELYNSGQEYRRRPVSPQGAECDYFAFTDRAFDEAAFECDSGRAGARPFAASHLPADAGLYLRQRTLVNGIASGALREPLAIEESALELLDEALRRARHGPRQRRVEPRPSSRKRRETLAHEAAQALAADCAQPLSLGALARSLRASPFHLCRVFRECTGRSLHGYRTELRLRSSLERIEQGCDITTTALDLGFSSHSHFTSAFRRAFGLTPSRFAREGRRALQGERPGRH